MCGRWGLHLLLENCRSRGERDSCRFRSDERLLDRAPSVHWASSRAVQGSSFAPNSCPSFAVTSSRFFFLCLSQPLVQSGTILEEFAESVASPRCLPLGQSFRRTPSRIWHLEFFDAQLGVLATDQCGRRSDICLTTNQYPNTLEV